jgi:hypothetical protein
MPVPMRSSRSSPPVALAIAAVALVTVRAARRRRRRRLPARAVIVSPKGSTAVAEDGSVHSVQTAKLTLSLADLERMWNPSNLENLAATYWRFLTRATLGLIRVAYGENERAVVLIARPLTLLRFDAPEYVVERDRGNVRWRIRDGVLVARSGRGSGYLSVDVRRLGSAAAPELDDPPANVGAPPGSFAQLLIEVEVANFYPAIAARFSRPVYQVTQSVIHVLVTHAFLRSLASLDLAQSRVGALARTAAARRRSRRRSAVANAGQGPELATIVTGGDSPHRPRP